MPPVFFAVCSLISLKRRSLSLLDSFGFGRMRHRVVRAKCSCDVNILPGINDFNELQKKSHRGIYDR